MTLKFLAGMAGLFPYALLIVGILRSNVRQSFAAFLLWSMLDAIAAVTSILQHGNFALALANAAGSATIAVVLMMKGQVKWTRVETLTGVLVVICLAIWFAAGARVALMASTAAVVLASIPQMADTFRDPNATPLLPYLIFLSANVLSVFAGDAWTIEERLYASGSVFLTAVILILKLISSHSPRHAAE